MIRKPVKIGSIHADDGAVKDLAIPTGHRGTYCSFYFMPYDADTPVSDTAVVLDAVEKLTLEATSHTEGGFQILNDVTPEFLYFREQYYAQQRGITNTGSIITYDPSAAQRGGEAAANIRNIGTADLSDMNLRMTFKSTVADLTRIDVYADIDYNLKAKIGVHNRIAHVTAPVPAAGGVVEITNLPCVDGRYAYETMIIQEPSKLTADRTSLVVNGSDWQFRDIPRKLFERMQVEACRKPQSGFAVYDFAKEDSPLYFLPGGMAELKLIPEFTAAGGATAGSAKIWFELLRVA
ncbi:MAG: hypothetical protein WC959_07625 [Kiritimatiellales bacterium]